MQLTLYFYINKPYRLVPTHIFLNTFVYVDKTLISTVINWTKYTIAYEFELYHRLLNICLLRYARVVQITRLQTGFARLKPILFINSNIIFNLKKTYDHSLSIKILHKYCLIVSTNKSATLDSNENMREKYGRSLESCSTISGYKSAVKQRA